MVRLVVQLTEEQAEGLKRLAAAQGVSVAELMRRGADLVRQERHNRERSLLWERAAACIGAFDSGRGDLADQHDAYLNEAYNHADVR